MVFQIGNMPTGEPIFAKEIKSYPDEKLHRCSRKGKLVFDPNCAWCLEEEPHPYE